MDFDVIVVGSGFGGAVAACRLTAAGAKVLVLERGRRWAPDSYPRKVTDPWLFSQRRPQKYSGWLEVRVFKGMTVIQGAGVGGGSLSYAGVLVAADSECFASGWPPEITAHALAPYYEKARQMLGAQLTPLGQETHRAKLLRRAAENLGYMDRLERMPLGISFDPKFSYDLPNPIDPKHSIQFTNDHGVQQGTCVHLGNCQVGCDVGSKNTLDVNYLAAAERLGAEVRPLHTVRSIEPSEAGYRVRFERVERGSLTQGEATADRVILAGGSLGSTELLLRCRDEHRTLTKIGSALGTAWSGNANVMTPAFYPRTVNVHQGIGPMITSSLTFMDGAINGQRFVIEEDGFPNVVLNALAGRRRGRSMSGRFTGRLRRGFDELSPTAQVMMWLGAGLDAGDGRLFLKRPFCAPWRRDLNLDWRIKDTKGVIASILSLHSQLSEVDRGSAKVSPLWTLFRALTTVHPLGGCPMSENPEIGVVDHRGEVHGHPNLFVLDGAIIPRPVGRNPSLTIAALAERGADLIARTI